MHIWRVNAPQQKINKTNAAFEHGHQLLFLFWVRIFLHISKVFRYFQKITQESNNWMARRTLQDGVYSRTKRATHKTSLSSHYTGCTGWFIPGAIKILCLGGWPMRPSTPILGRSSSLHLHVSSVAERGQCSSQVFVSLAIQGLVRRCRPRHPNWRSINLVVSFHIQSC